jgi:O-antigen/teichoic acid export membrane protein
MPGKLPALGPGLRSILRNGSFQMGITLTESLLRAVYLVAIAHFISAADYGLWAYGGASYGLLMGLVILGFDFLIPSRIGADKSGAASFIGMTLALRLALLALAAGALATYAFTLEPPGPARIILLALIPALMGRGMALWARICFLAYERLGFYLPVTVILRSLEVGLGVLWLVNGGGLMNIVVLLSVVGVIEGLAGVVMVRWLLTEYRFGFSLGEARAFLRKGAVLGLGGALGIWLIMGPLVLLRHATADLALIGQVGLALNVMMILVASAQSFMGAALPVLSRSLVRGDPRLASYGRLTALASLGAAIPAGIIGIVLGPPAAVFAFGPDFATAGALLGPCLLVGGIIVAPTGYAQILAAKGRRWPGVWASGIGSVILVLAMAPLVQAWGGYGAVAAIALAWTMRAVIVSGVAWRMERADD